MMDEVREVSNQSHDSLGDSPSLQFTANDRNGSVAGVLFFRILQTENGAVPRLLHRVRNRA